MNDWELSGVLVRLGDLALKYARRHNDDVELYGYRSVEALFAWCRFQTVAESMRCFKGFDVDWVVCESDTRKIKEFYITYNGKKIGLPWKVVR